VSRKASRTLMSTLPSLGAWQFHRLVWCVSHIGVTTTTGMKEFQVPKIG